MKFRGFLRSPRELLSPNSTSPMCCGFVEIIAPLVARVFLCRGLAVHLSPQIWCPRFCCRFLKSIFCWFVADLLYILYKRSATTRTSGMWTLVLRRRRGRRFKQRLVRLCRLPPSPPTTVTAAAAAAAEMTWSPWRWRASSLNDTWPDEQAHCSSVHAEFNPNYTSLEMSQGLVAIDHDLTEIPKDCLVVIRYVHGGAEKPDHCTQWRFYGAPQTVAAAPQISRNRLRG